MHAQTSDSLVEYKYSLAYRSTFLVTMKKARRGRYIMQSFELTSQTKIYDSTLMDGIACMILFKNLAKGSSGKTRF